MSYIEQVAERIKSAGIIAIFRGNYSPERILELSEALIRNGIEVLEVTLNSSDALKSIERLRENWGGEALIGAGTVRIAPAAEEALGAGAQFLISPHVDACIARLAAERRSLYLPGALTPTEVQSAVSAGCKLVKLFPADTFGPAYLKALRAPLNDVDFVPTGGVSQANLAEYVKAGAVAVGLGSSLLTGPEQSASDLGNRAAKIVVSLQEVRRRRGS